jgi:hypothetical protein
MSTISLGRRFVLRSVEPGRPMLLAVLFAVITVGLEGVATLPIALYLPTCPCNVQLGPTIYQLPIPPLAAGVAFALLMPIRAPLWKAVAQGLLLGVAGAMYQGLFSSVWLALQTNYLTTPYRIYAMAHLAAVTMFATLVAVLMVRRGNALSALGLALATVIVISIGSATLRYGPLLGAVAAAAAAGAALAIRRRTRLPDLTPYRYAAVATIVFASFAVRVIFGLQALARLGAGMPFAIASDDGDSYYKGAVAILTSDAGMQNALANPWFPPGYTIFVAGLFGKDENFTALIIAQSAIAAIGTLCVYLIGRSFLSPGPALAAAGLFALDVDLIGIASTLTAEALLLPLLLAGMFGAVRYRETRRFRWLVFAAACLGAAFITRNLSIVLLASVALWLVATGWREPRVLARDLSTMLIVTVLFTAPTALATSGAGETRLTNQSSIVAFDTPVNGVTIDNGELLARGIHLTKDPAGSMFRLLRDPGFAISFFARAVPNRLSTLLFAPSNGTFDPITVINPAYHPSAFGQSIALGLAVLLGLATLLFVTRRTYSRPGVPLLLAVYTISYVGLFTLVFLPSHPFRYRAPVEPMLFLAEMAALSHIARRF